MSDFVDKVVFVPKVSFPAQGGKTTINMNHNRLARVLIFGKKFLG